MLEYDHWWHVVVSITRPHVKVCGTYHELLTIMDILTTSTYYVEIQTKRKWKHVHTIEASLLLKRHARCEVLMSNPHSCFAVTNALPKETRCCHLQKF